MKKLLLGFLLLLFLAPAFAQKVDSIYFHLYTDSLKKGQHNYINVDGKLSDGRWKPMTDREVIFSCTTASFEGNELIIPDEFSNKTVLVRAVLRANPAVWIEKTIGVKQIPDPELPDPANRSTPRSRSGNKNH